MKQETLSKGEIVSYKLRFPFNEFANLTTPKKNKPTSYEPTPSLINQSVLVNNNQNVQSGYMNFCEPQFTDKNQGVTLKNATPLQSGWRRRAVSEYIYNVYLNGLCNLFVEALAFKE